MPLSPTTPCRTSLPLAVLVAKRKMTAATGVVWKFSGNLIQKKPFTRSALRPSGLEIGRRRREDSFFANSAKLDGKGTWIEVGNMTETSEG